MNFDIFVKDCKSYADFARLMKEQDSKEKGDYSEEYFLRFFKWAPWLTDVKGIYNTNDPKSKFLVHKYPELQPLGVGTPNSPVVDLIIEHTEGYSLVSAKWYTHGLQLNDIAALYGIDADKGYPNLKYKYLATNAPRTSQVVQQVFKHNHPVIKVLEDDFDVLDEEFAEIIANKEVKSQNYDKWTWRTKREQESFIRLIRRCRKEYRTKFQGPPGWGKTYLMWRMDKYFWKRFGGQTICMADGVIVLKQNFDLYNKQYKASGIERPSLVICSGADDESMVDWPVEVVGNDPVKIARWLKANPDGMVFCFYGNTKSLEAASNAIRVDNSDYEFTFVACDEASRTCLPLGSGWSHIVHDSCVPVKHRVFLDATHRSHKQYGMNVKSLYGEMGDHVSQAESEHYGSTTGYFVKGMIFESKKLQKLFHAREFAKGKKYTIEEKAMAVKLLEEFAEDPTMEHNLVFGLTIKGLKHFAEALNDARTELLKKYKSKKYQELAEIEIYVADTHVHTSRDIRDKLENVYKTKKRSIVLTSRLLYRGWSQVKLDSIVFSDNFKGISYIIQALGRGLRKNEARPDKICKVIIPVDLDNSGPWDHVLNILKSLANWDFRPIESIIGLNKKPRSKAGRRPQSGSVVLPMSGHSINAADIKRGLKNVLITETDWMEWNIWWDLARDYFKKLEARKYLIRQQAKGMLFVKDEVAQELCLNDNYNRVIQDGYKNVSKETMPNWLYRKIVANGFKGIKRLPDYINFHIDLPDVRETNEATVEKLVRAWFDDCQQIRKDFALAAQRTVGHKYKDFTTAVDANTEKHKEKLKAYYPGRSDKQWFRIGRDYCFGGAKHFSDYTYYEQEIARTEEYIAKAKQEYVRQVTEFALDLHKTTYTPLVKLKKPAVEAFPDLQGPRWVRWVFNQEIENDLTCEWNQYLETPALNPSRPVCECCSKRSAERANVKLNIYHKFCGSCIREKQRQRKKTGTNG